MAFEMVLGVAVEVEYAAREAEMAEADVEQAGFEGGAVGIAVVGPEGWLVGWVGCSALGGVAMPHVAAGAPKPIINATVFPIVPFELGSGKKCDVAGDLRSRGAEVAAVGTAGQVDGDGSQDVVGEATPAGIRGHGEQG